ncbi:CaiB/BaiF CoA transferase family protein [Thermodesulfobacteriota bacterium]
MVEGALCDLKIVEYADFISGPFCGKLLADLGAEVIKVEPPGGDKARRSGPFLDDVPHPERSGLYLYLNTNKLGISFDLQSTAGAGVFKELIKQADILIENNPPRVMKEFGLAYETLGQMNPRLIMTSISPFGQSGPYRDCKATNLVSMHMGGVGYYTPGSVDNLEAEPPLKGGGHQAHFVAGLMAALASLSGIFLRTATGGGQHIDISEHEAVAFNLLRDIADYSYDKIVASRLKSQARGFGNLLPCKDGYVQLYVTDQRQWHGLLETMGSPEWAKDERYRDPGSRTANWDSLEPRIIEWTKDRLKEEIYQAVQPNHVACAPVNTVAEVLGSRQLSSREFFVEIDHPDTGKLTYPGAPCKFSETPFRVNRRAPGFGEHNEEIIVKRLGYTRHELVRMRESGVI